MAAGMSGTSGSRDPRYDSPEWRALRKRILERDPWCQHGGCGGFNRSRVADHVKPVRDGGDFWDQDNIMGVCRACHRLKSRIEQGARGDLKGGRARQVKPMVQGVDPDTGSPLAGWSC